MTYEIAKISQVVTILREKAKSTIEKDPNKAHSMLRLANFFVGTLPITFGGERMSPERVLSKNRRDQAQDSSKVA
jgi:hypothetical protein